MPPPLPRCSGWAYSSLRTTHPCQPSPNPLSGRPAHCPFRDLLSVHSRCGLRTRTVTKLVTAIRGLQTFRHLHACPGCFRLERCRVGLAPTGEAPPFHGARGQRTYTVGCLGQKSKPAIGSQSCSGWPFVSRPNQITIIPIAVTNLVTERVCRPQRE